jgi:hypothetical protein
MVSSHSRNLVLSVCEQNRCKLFAFEQDEPSIKNLLKYYAIRKLALACPVTKFDTREVPASLLVNNQLPTLAWLHSEYAKKIELEPRIPHQLRVSIYYFRIVRFYNYETILLLAGGLSLGCVSLYYFSKLFYDHAVKYLPVGRFGLIRLSIIGSSESMLFYFCSQLATYGYFLPREYLVRRKVLSGDYMSVSEYYSWFLNKYPHLDFFQIFNIIL